MSEPYPQSYYAASARPLAPFAPLAGDVTADVCVVGGGFTGVNTALELAARGREVVLLEANRIGWGASGRNGGQVTGSLSGDVAMAREFGRVLGARTADYIWNLRWRGHRILAARVAEHGIACDLKYGHVQTAMKPAHVAELRVMYEEALARGMGDEVAWVEGAEMRALVDSPLYLAGLVNRRNMHLHPLDLCRGEARAAAGIGVRIFEESAVLAIEPGTPAMVRTASGTVRAGQVLLAGNAYHRLGRGRMRGALFPASLGVVATEPLSEEVARAINPQDLAIYDNRFVLDYHRLSADRRLIFGGGTNYSGRDSRDIAAELRPAIEATYPRLKGVRIDYGWTGKAGIIVNRIPHLGRVAPNLWYAEGYSGHGIATSHVVAEIAAKAMTGDAEEFALFEQVRHLRLPVGTRAGHLALAAGMGWFRLKERFR